jgi:hypothetical protein
MIKVNKVFSYIPFLFLLLFLTSCSGGGGGSDGGASISPPDTGTATLTWSAPATNSDGSQLTDLAGFKIYYGTKPGSYPQAIDVGPVTRYQVTNLSMGTTYYFVITAYNQVGVESTPSNEKSKLVD